MSLRRGTRRDFVGRLGASGDGNMSDQVEVGGGESTKGADWERGHFRIIPTFIHSKQAGRVSCSSSNVPCLSQHRDHGIFAMSYFSSSGRLFVPDHSSSAHSKLAQHPFLPFYHTAIMNLHSNLSVTLSLSAHCTPWV